MASHSEEARKATEGLVAAPAKRESEKQLEEAKQARIVRLRRLLVVVGFAARRLCSVLLSPAHSSDVSLVTVL